MAIRMPETIQCKTEELSENEWNLLQETINKAVIEFSNFRKTEGEILGEELTKNIKNIEELLGQVQPFEEERIPTIKERYLSSLKDFEQRVAGQPSDEYLRSKAATVIDNSKDEDLLATYVNAWWDALMTKLDMRH